MVEDDETMASVLSAYLTRAGYEALWASDGTEALDYVEPSEAGCRHSRHLVADHFRP